MRIAVLMSTYNGAKFIKEQIDSILNQRGLFDLDLIVRDDGSCDNTQNILQEYADRGLLKWYTGENLGPAISFLDLVKKNQGYDFYAFADQDDYWMPNKIQLALEQIGDKKGLVLYFSNAELVDCNLKSLGRNVYKVAPKTDFYTLSCAGGILGCTTVFNAELAKMIQSRELPKRIVMHDFYLDELCLSLEGKIICDMHPTMKYRQHDANVVGMSHGVWGTIKSRIHDIIERQRISISDQAEELLKLYRANISNDYIFWLEKIVMYKKNIASRFKLAASAKTKYMNWNMGLKLRLSILLGNR